MSIVGYAVKRTHKNSRKVVAKAEGKSAQIMYTFSVLSPFNVKYAICYYYLLLYSNKKECLGLVCTLERWIVRNDRMRVGIFDSGQIKCSDFPEF